VKAVYFIVKNIKNFFSVNYFLSIAFKYCLFKANFNLRAFIYVLFQLKTNFILFTGLEEQIK